MNSQTQLLLSLQEYIVELETENRALKSHIFILQDRLEKVQASQHDELQKLRVHIEHCENQINKRENREVGLIDAIQELEMAKEQAFRQRDIYIAEIESLRKEMAGRQEQLTKMSRMHVAKSALPLPPSPKPARCKNCEVYIKNQEILHNQLRQHQVVIQSLQQDLTCLTDFI